MFRVFVLFVSLAASLMATLSTGVNIAGPYGNPPGQVFVTINEAGDALAVWDAINESMEYELYSSYYHGGVWTPIGTSTNTQTTSNAPLNNSGTAWAVVQESTTNNPLAALYFNGSTWGSPTTISGMQALSAGIQLTVAYNNLSQAIVIWEGNDAHIYANVNNNGGSGGWGANPHDVSGSGNNETPVVALSDNQTAIVLWTSDSSTDQIYYATYSFETNTWSSASPLHSSGDQQSSPSVSINASGEAVAAWTENTTNAEVFASFYSGSWSTPTNISNVTGSEQAFSPKVGISSSGDAFAVWQLVGYAGGLTPTQGAVYSGGTWGATTIISPTDNYSTVSPSLAASGSANALAAWDQTYMVNGHYSSHAVNISGYDGIAWSSSYPLSSQITGTVNNDYAPSGVALNSAGDGAVAWSYFDGSMYYYVQASIGSVFTSLLPPNSAQGRQLKNRLPFQTQHLNRIEWTASPSANAVGYQISRNGTLIATVSELEYDDQAILTGQTYTYQIAAIDSEGNQSSTISLIVTP